MVHRVTFTCFSHFMHTAAHNAVGRLDIIISGKKTETQGEIDLHKSCT